eukprot:364782-Chlamydomonas_euryale.AAC.11
MWPLFCGSARLVPSAVLVASGLQGWGTWSWALMLLLCSASNLALVECVVCACAYSGGKLSAFLHMARTICRCGVPTVWGWRSREWKAWALPLVCLPSRGHCVQTRRSILSIASGGLAVPP